MKIAVAGAGYVGLSLAIMLATKHEVTVVDVLPAKVDQINRRICPLHDTLMQDYLQHQTLNLTATLDGTAAYRDAELIIIATPTDYQADHHQFDTHLVEAVIESVLAVNQTAPMVIKSTVPVGYTESVRNRYAANIIFAPEFLREARALSDNLHPSRIIIGVPANDPAGQTFAQILQACALEPDIPVRFMPPTEAEAVKLFANTYLAMRVAFFNELDTYAAAQHLDAAAIIDAVGLDPRIGQHYHNPSFGYGGYCLPKDTQQLRANFQNLPECLISATIQANQTRKDFIAAQIMAAVSATTNPVIGIYRLTMKTGADNFRQSAVLGIIERLQNHDTNLIIYEPLIKENSFRGIPVINDLADFKRAATLIVANRMEKDLADVRERVYTRDIYQKD